MLKFFWWWVVGVKTWILVLSFKPKLNKNTGSHDLYSAHFLNLSGVTMKMFWNSSIKYEPPQTIFIIAFLGPLCIFVHLFLFAGLWYNSPSSQKDMDRGTSALWSNLGGHVIIQFFRVFLDMGSMYS